MIIFSQELNDRMNGYQKSCDIFSALSKGEVRGYGIAQSTNLSLSESGCWFPSGVQSETLLPRDDERRYDASEKINQCSFLTAFF